jgi:hypothetical protein
MIREWGNPSGSAVDERGGRGDQPECSAALDPARKSCVSINGARYYSPTF